MTKSFNSAIVRIRDTNGHVVGAGFLVGQRQVLTCTHVIDDTLGRLHNASEMPQVEVHLDFPLVAPDQPLTARVVCWQPSQPNGSGDVAVLELTDDPPAGASPVRLVKAEEPWGNSFHAFGFPDGYDNGVWASGQMLDREATGWLQIEDVKHTGYFIAPGFSGGPVWDETLKGVVGMTVAADTTQGIRAAFIIPTDRLVAAWPELEHSLLEPPAPLGEPNNVPKLPRHFLPRSKYLEPLKATVLADVDKPIAFTGATRKVVVSGMGGIGKSVLAVALARDDDVRRAFPDGVLWVTLGRTPDPLTARQKQIADALEDEPHTFTDVQQGRARLSVLLADKNCLLILDDVWDAIHVRPFDMLGPRCRMLVTTRDARLIVALGAAECRLDVLDTEQALQLLARWAKLDVDTLPPEANEVAEECGNLPLALAMVGAMVRGRPDRWANALHRLRSADLQKIRQQFPDYPYPDLLRAIQVSVQALEPDAQTRYLDLAVFPDDTPVPEVVLQILWAAEGLDEYDVQDVLDDLVDRSLARRDEAGCLTLHDLQYDYVRQQTDNLPALHQRLLRAYAAQCPEGWPTGPDDGYYFQHLPNHLTEVGQANELRELLLDFDWLQAKLEAVDVAALLADYELLPGDAELQLVQGAIGLSAHVITRDKTQLAGQMLGRLLAFQIHEIEALLDKARHWRATPWLRPVVPSLTPPGGPLLRTLRGHTSEVNAITLTPDGRYVISAAGSLIGFSSHPGDLKVWDLESGAEIRTLSGHKERVTSVTVTPNGQQVISASDDGTIKVWDLASGTELRTLKGHTDWVNAVAVTPDGHHVISASKDFSLKVWDLDAGLELRTLTGHSHSVIAVAVTPDGRYVVSGSIDKTLKVWDLESGAELHTLVGHTDSINAVTVTPDGLRAVSGSNDKTIKVWDLESGAELRTLSGHTHWVQAVTTNPDGDKIISGSDLGDKTIRIWDLEHGKELQVLRGHTDMVNDVVVTPSGRYALSASHDKTIRVWDLWNRTEPGEYHSITRMTMMPDGQRAAFCFSGGRLEIWDLAQRKKLHTLTGHAKWIWAMTVTPDGQHIVTTSEDKTLKIWDLDSGVEACTLSGHAKGVIDVAVTPDGKRIVSASSDQTLKVWNLESRTELFTLRGHNDTIHAVAITPDGRQAISASTDKTLKVWDLESGREIFSLSGHTGFIDAVVVSPDGQRVISGSRDCTLKVWDLKSGTELHTLRGHDTFVDLVKITPDGRYVISAGSFWADTTLRVWDPVNGTELFKLSGHTNSIRALAVSKDGQRVVSGSEDYTLRLWDLEKRKLIASFNGDCGFRACAIMPDGKTLVAGDEWGRVHILRLEGI
jgi:WD40 repeat protein/S1-C subfamily serine protease